MLRRTALRTLLPTLVLGLSACAAPTAPWTPPPQGAADDAGAGPVPDADTPFVEGGGKPGAVGQLTGTVMAPNGTMPVAGALVYLTPARPAAQPAKVYCDQCVKLPSGAPYAIADAKGAFTLSPTSTGSQYLVVQKGGFRKVREIYVSKGDDALPNTLTTLPSKTDLVAGDEVPRMTVVQGQYDEIEASLVKLGIDASAIELVHSPLIGVAAKSFLTDANALGGRHIVFLPCGDFTQPSPNVDLSTDATIQKNLRDFVAAGGRVYATDWHYDFIARTFPGLVSFHGESATACSGCGKVPYTAAAEVIDPSLSSWMTAQGLSTFALEKNYTSIDAVHSAQVTTSWGTKTVTPKVWVRGSVNGAAPRPATVSFEYGCGRVLFSTYHTEPFSLSLTAQERALLGVLLEVTVCNDSDNGVIVN